VDIVKKYNVDGIYHLASLLSATSEQLPGLAWDLNLVSLKHVLEIAKEFNIKKVHTIVCEAFHLRIKYLRLNFLDLKVLE
jgi:nucleoside-diphosphate-sugar epimerase